MRPQKASQPPAKLPFPATKWHSGPGCSLDISLLLVLPTFDGDQAMRPFKGAAFANDLKVCQQPWSSTERQDGMRVWPACPSCCIHSEPSLLTFVCSLPCSGTGQPAGLPGITWLETQQPEEFLSPFGCWSLNPHSDSICSDLHLSTPTTWRPSQWKGLSDGQHGEGCRMGQDRGSWDFLGCGFLSGLPG